MRSAVSTTGDPPTRCWRAATSRDGTCQRSSAPTHQSSDQPPGHGVTRPRGSTVASRAESRLPTVVQFRPVRLARNGRWPPGRKAVDRGSSWRSSQWGHSQPPPWDGPPRRHTGADRGPVGIGHRGGRGSRARRRRGRRCGPSRGASRCAGAWAQSSASRPRRAGPQRTGGASAPGLRRRRLLQVGQGGGAGLADALVLGTHPPAQQSAVGVLRGVAPVDDGGHLARRSASRRRTARPARPPPPTS